MGKVEEKKEEIVDLCERKSFSLHIVCLLITPLPFFYSCFLQKQLVSSRYDGVQLETLESRGRKLKGNSP